MQKNFVRFNPHGKDPEGNPIFEGVWDDEMTMLFTRFDGPVVYSAGESTRATVLRPTSGRLPSVEHLDAMAYKVTMHGIYKTVIFEESKKD